MPRKFAKYELIRELGRGAQAVVYEARDTKLDRVVALKVLLPGTRSDESVRRFQREARAAARLKHENVISIYEVGDWQDRHYMAMELVDDDPLDKRIGGRGLPVKEAVSIAKQVAEAVGAAHEAGIIHRDIKPGNILIEKGGRPKLTDFGLALDEAAQAKLTRSGTFVGTVFYVSPEQAKGKSGAADARSDIYSLGAVLYEMLTGRPPFKAMTSLMLLEKIVNDTPRAPSEMRKGIPRDVETIALKCLEKEPDRRYQTAQEFAEDCARFLAGEPISARPASALYVARRSVARHKGPVLVMLGLAVIAMLSAWVVYLQSSGDEARPPSPPHVSEGQVPGGPDRSWSGPRRKLAEIRAKIDPELTNYATARTALEAFASFFPDAREEISEAEALLAEIDGAYAALAEKALEEAEKEAAALAQESEADGAIARIRAVRDTYRHGPWLAERGEGLVAAALTRIDQILLLKASEEVVATAGRDTVPGEVAGAQPDEVTRVPPPAEGRGPPVEAGGVPRPVQPKRHVPRPPVESAPPGRDRPGDLRRGLVGHWAFDRGDMVTRGGGPYVRDLSGRSNHGRIRGATLAKGKIGGALRFEGGGACVELGNRSSLRITGDQTIAMWICPSSLGKRQGVYAKCYGGEGTITLERDGTLHYFYGTSGSREAPYHGFRITTPLPVASWTHLVIVRDLKNRKLRWYADGIETNTGLAKFASARASDLPAYLGRGYVGDFEGLLDDVRVYSRALSQDEIHELAAMGESDPGPGRTIVQRPVPVRPEHTRLPARALSVFDSLVEKGDYAGAHRAAREAARDRANADDADVLLAAARVAATLRERAGAARRGAASRVGRKVELRAKVGTRRGTVDRVTDEGIVLSTAYTINRQVRRKRLTVRWSELSPAQIDELAREGGWRTVGADGAVAMAYLARARRDFPAAMKALGSAGGHPLAPHVLEKVEAPGRAAAETAARAAWARIERSPAASRILSYKSVPAEFRDKGWICPQGGPYRAHCVEFSPDSRYLAAGGYSSSSSTALRSTPVGLWDASTGKKAKGFVGLANYAQCMAFSRDGKKLAAGGQDGSVIVWDVASEALLKRFPGQTQYVMAVAFSPDDRILAAASRDGTATLWDASTGKLLRSIKGDTTYSYVYAAAFSPDGRWLATGGYDRTAALWALPAGTKKKLLTGHTGYVKSLAFSSNGRYVATGSYDNTAALWNVLTGTRVRTFEGLGACVYSVALSSDGRMLATGCADGTVALWDCSTSRKLKTFGPRAGDPATSSNYVYSVAISPDGQFLATGGYRSMTRIWLIREKAKLAPQEARLLLERLFAFEGDHGRTEFARSVAEKMANMTAAATRWLAK